MNGGATRDYDALIVGAGFSGLYMLYRLRGMGLSARVIEAGSGVGGTWFWNRYPGARCDVESMDYCYSFDEALQQEWQWSERYPPQPEILKYLEHVADRYGLRRDIDLETRVAHAQFDDSASRWTLTTDGGAVYRAQFCVMATGCLSTPRVPEFPGLDSYAGRRYHTAQWPHEEVDFSGQVVGCIGTGSTGIQVIPMIARQAKQVYVFQRTPNFSIPAHNGPLDGEFERQRKAHYPEHRAAARASFFGVPFPLNDCSALSVSKAERDREYEARWQVGGATPIMTAFADVLINEAANDTVAEFVRDKIRAIVHNPRTAALLCPTDHPLGTKRICVDTDYYATFNRPNVQLVDVRSAPIEALTPRGLRTREAQYTLDSIVFATGFDAMTGALLQIDIRGTGGQSLRDKWSAGPRSYLGLMTAGFPNLFIMTGPGSPSVLSNMVVSIEQHVDWVAACIARLREQGIRQIAAQPEAEEAWATHVAEVANGTLFPRANSWYVGANVPGKPRGFMPYVGGVGAYAETCAQVAAEGYRGFTLSR